MLEVETPILAAAGVTDLHLHSLTTHLKGRTEPVYLQTSPEYAMKRLLASGSGAIYQITRAFRDDETGSRHNPEFTLLEWYRVGWDHQALMNEVDELLGVVLGEPAAERLTYAEVFARHLGIDPHSAPREALDGALAEAKIQVDAAALDRDTVLQLLLAQAIEPRLPRDRPTFLFDFPTNQAALARIRRGPPPVAERFEVYVRGVELANGYHELRDADEQERRFERDLEARRERGLPAIEPDRRLLAALCAGLPACAGVALGVDRLVMLATGVDRIEEVLAFPIDRA